MKKRKLFLICCIYTVVLFIMGTLLNGGPDTYNALSDYKSFMRIPLSNGRFMHAFFVGLLGIISEWSITVSFYCSLFISFSFYVYAEYRYGYYLCETFERKNATDGYIMVFFSCITLLNVFSTEYIMYPETNPTWAFAIFACVEATIAYSKYICFRKNVYLALSFLFTLAVAFSYQILLAAFVILTLPVVLIKSDSFKAVLKNQISVVVLYFIPMLANFVYTKVLMKNERAEGVSNSVSEAIQVYIPEGRAPEQFILNRISIGMWIYLVLCFLVATYLIYKVTKQKKSVEIIKGIYISAIVVFFGVLPYIAKMSDDFSPRLYYPLGMLLGILLIYSFIQGYLENVKGSFLVFILLMAFLNQLFSNVQIFVDRYITNYEDRYLSNIYGQFIEEYEKENNTSIKYICFYQDAVKTKYVRNSGWCLSMRVYGVNWGNLDALNYYLETDYKAGVYDEEMAKSFVTQNWDGFSKDQLVFEGDTVHICRY